MIAARLKNLALAGAVTAASLAALSPLSQTHAATFCRSDPAVWLSNGLKVQLSSGIGADPSIVTDIEYQLAIPTGVSVVKVVYTQGKLGTLEHLRISATNNKHTQYVSTASVAATVSAPDQAQMQLVDPHNGWNETLSHQGFTNQTVTLDEENAG